MPKIKINRTNGQYHQSSPPQRRGLRDSHYDREAVELPPTQRERDDFFDMYRIDDNGNRGNRRPPAAKRRNDDGRPKLWYLACLVAALGAFCLFVDSVSINVTGIPIRLTSLEILTRSSEIAGGLPDCAMYMSAVPAVFLIILGTFAFLKEDAFEKGYLALIAVSVFVIVVQIHWMGQIADSGIGYLLTYSSGTAELIEIGCSVALIAITVCQRVWVRVGGNGRR